MVPKSCDTFELFPHLDDAALTITQDFNGRLGVSERLIDGQFFESLEKEDEMIRVLRKDAEALGQEAGDTLHFGLETNYNRLPGS